MKEELRNLLNQGNTNMINVEFNIKIPLDLWDDACGCSINSKRLQTSLVERNSLASPNENTKNKITLTLTALHLAIITKQTDVATILIEHIEDLEDVEGERYNILRAALTRKIIFKSTDIDIPVHKNYQCVLEGMSALHLACQFDSKAAKLLIGTFDQFKIPISEIIKLLMDQDNHLKQTPFHISLKNSKPYISR